MKTAVVLFNLGGPDGPAAVRPFLTNLFSDPAILRVPDPLRPLLAWWIAKRRALKAIRIYAELGGASPILDETRAQAEALQNVLDERGEYRVFIAMRYWHPFSEEAARDVARYAPRSDMSAAPLSSILDDDDGVVAERLATGGEDRRDRPAHDRRVLLSDR